MSLLRDFQFRELTSFGGAWLLQDPSTVPETAALRSRNVEFSSGMVGVRHGFQGTGLNTGGIKAVELYAWTGPFSSIGSGEGDGCIAYYDPAGHFAAAGVDVMNVKSGNTAVAANDGSSPVPVGVSFVGVGMRLYMAFFDANQRGALTNGHVFTAYGSAGSLNGTPNTQLFAGPCIMTPSNPLESAAGVVTTGVHRFGYLLEYDSGFTTRVSPDGNTTTPPSLATFAPTSYTATGSKNLVFTLNPTTGGLLTTWPAGIAAISLVMTTITNLNQYYVVPGSRTTVTTILDFPKTITVNISDADLSSQGIDATPYLYLMTANASDTRGGSHPNATAPFVPSHIALFGDRMAYKTTSADTLSNPIDCLYISDRNNYQSLTADQHFYQLPGQRPITTMFRMGTSNYVAGPHEIYSVTDNGDVPSTWSAAQLVDGRHGTLAVHGVEVAPSGNYAWLADQGGLYVFTGAPITSLPVSYQQTPDWNRINWSKAYQVKVKDDASTKRVYVMAPLDGATVPSHMMTFDYTNGLDAVAYSLDNISGYALASMELVRNDLSAAVTGDQKKIELWIGSGTSSTLLRRVSDNATTPYRDVTSTAISAAYRTCPLPGRQAAGGVISMHHGFHARLKGAGTLTPTLYDIDAARSFTCRAITLATAPDADILCAADLRGELAFVEFATNTADTHWQLAYLKYYYSPYLMQR